MTVLRVGYPGGRAVKIAIWMETADGKGSLGIFEPFHGDITVDFNFTDYVDEHGFVGANRIPGGQLRIEGSYKLVHSASSVDPPALPEST